MANKPLKSIQFPGLADTYTVPRIDDTLIREGYAADAKVVGDALRAIVPGLTDEAKEALLACFRNVAWLNWEESGESLYNALCEALDVEPPQPTPTFEYGVYTQEETVNGQYIDANGDIVEGQENKSFYIPDYIPVIRESYWIALQPSTMRGKSYGDGNIYSESNWRVSEYDADKVFIKQTQMSNPNAYSAKVITFDEDTKYIRLGWYDPYSSAIKHFEIENPTTIVNLPMESGDINASTGANATQVLRIRTTGSIEVSGSTLSVSGCPFADSWAEFTMDNPTPTSVYGVRCYNSNNGFLGSLGGYKADIQDVALPSGTKYIRFIMQFASSGSFARFAQLVNHQFIVNGTKYFVTGA